MNRNEAKTIEFARKFVEEPWPFPNSHLLMLIAKLADQAEQTPPRSTSCMKTATPWCCWPANWPETIIIIVVSVSTRTNPTGL